ncbi:hypothetical protein J3E74DRAFT_373646 [Bipolaris maydis]|nr:hypothetical protein J3E74DRAFT_373646 [Bipolaris maydis]
MRRGLALGWVRRHFSLSVCGVARPQFRPCTTQRCCKDMAMSDWGIPHISTELTPCAARLGRECVTRSARPPSAARFFGLVYVVMCT